MATAYRSGWHFIDLVTAIPHSGDSLMVTVFGEPVVVTRDEDGDVRAYRCLRRPRGAPKPVRCAIRYGMIFVNLDQRDRRQTESDSPAPPDHLGHPPQCLTRFPRRKRSRRCFPPQRRHRDLNTVTPLQFYGTCPGIAQIALWPETAARRGSARAAHPRPIARVSAISMTTRDGFGRGVRP
ncbi:hypothetical protein RKD26_003103 [Streptomyces calvus]